MPAAVAHGQIMNAWLVPSPDFEENASEPDSRSRYRFSASMKPGTRDKWAPYRLTAAELPARTLGRLT
ncbi:hypothetical protein [Amycolatopsis sp. lyj-108]|uniref:hypothetical protein n=1 Tax=Amycolatopsis sp. lyj-108 TaxID=2789286 RepID=UPI00397817AA